MPRIIEIPANQRSNSYTGRLPPLDQNGSKIPYPSCSKSFVFDSRPIALDRRHFLFNVTFMLPFHIEIERIDDDPDPNVGWKEPILLRMYEVGVDTIPSFDGLHYKYHGLKGERPPYTTKFLSFSDDLFRVRNHAFAGLHNLSSCILGDYVEVLCKASFSCCTNLKLMVLSPYTRVIGKYAFRSCTSIVAIFIPKSVVKIDVGAFSLCPRLRFIFFEDHATLEPMELNVFWKSFGVFMEEDFHKGSISPIQSLMTRFDSLPLHLTCVNPFVTPEQVIGCMRRHAGFLTGLEQCVNFRMTALHIMIVFNPIATIDAIMSCLDANLEQAFIRDSKNRTPLDYLLNQRRINIHTCVILHLSKHKIYS